MFKSKKGYENIRRYIVVTYDGVELVRNLLDETGKSGKRAGYIIQENIYLLTFECNKFEYELIQRRLAEQNEECIRVDRIIF